MNVYLICGCECVSVCLCNAVKCILIVMYGTPPALPFSPHSAFFFGPHLVSCFSPCSPAQYPLFYFHLVPPFLSLPKHPRSHPRPLCSVISPLTCTRHRDKPVPRTVRVWRCNALHRCTLNTAGVSNRKCVSVLLWSCNPKYQNNSRMLQ